MTERVELLPSGERSEALRKALSVPVFAVLVPLEGEPLVEILNARGADAERLRAHLASRPELGALWVAAFEAREAWLVREDTRRGGSDARCDDGFMTGDDTGGGAGE